jgi:hypothetical protein
MIAIRYRCWQILSGVAKNRYVHLAKESEYYKAIFFPPGYRGPCADPFISPTAWISVSCADGPMPEYPPLKVYLAMRKRTWEDYHTKQLGDDTPQCVPDDRDVIFSTDPICTFAAQLSELNDAGRAALQVNPGGSFSIVDLVRSMACVPDDATFLGYLVRDRA